MKRLLYSVLLFFFFTLSLVYASAQQSVNAAPDCVVGLKATATGRSISYDNRQSACTTWTLTYTVTGPSAINIEPEFAPDSGGQPGSWSVWPDVMSGTLPLSVATEGQISVYKFHPWVSINITSLTGTGEVRATLQGWRSGATFDSSRGVIPGTTPDLTTTISLTGAAQSACVTLAGRSGASVVITGTWNATLVFDSFIDPSAAAFSASVYDEVNDVWVASVTTNGNYFAEQAGGINKFCVRVSAFTSGTVTGTILSSTAVNLIFETVSGNGALDPPLTQTFGSSDGVKLQKTRSVSSANLTAATNTGDILTEKGGRWQINNSGTAASGVQGTISRAAGGGTVRHIIDCIGFAADSAAAVTAANVLLNVRDGATGAGTVIWQYALSMPTAAALGIQEVPATNFCGLGIVGSANTAMTIEFSAAVAGSIQSVNATGYDATVP